MSLASQTINLDRFTFIYSQYEELSIQNVENYFKVKYFKNRLQDTQVAAQEIVQTQKCYISKYFSSLSGSDILIIRPIPCPVQCHLILVSISCNIHCKMRLSQPL